MSRLFFIKSRTKLRMETPGLGRLRIQLAEPN
eukprot:COSAG01_NODE_24842_length_764_cov_1.478195_2_plen_31_part_01